MLADGLVVAVVVALLAGGRFSRLKELELRAVWVLVAAAGVQVGLMIAGVRSWDRVGAIGPVALMATFGLVVVWLWLNRRLPGVWVMMVGVALNFLVMAANGGSMPVDRGLAVRAGNKGLVEMLDSPAYVKHKPIEAGTRLQPLADVLPLPVILPRPRWFAPGSVGDVALTLGACWFVIVGMGAFGRRPRTNHEDTKDTKQQEQVAGGD